MVEDVLCYDGVFSSLCRQVVVDGSRDAKVFEVSGSYITVTVSGQIDVNVALVRESNQLHCV